MTNGEFKTGKIHDVVVRPLNKYIDERGWLAELFREDEIEAAVMPVMAYISMTQPGIARGPHEHADQTDYFSFIGPSNFKVYLWDTRPDSPTRGHQAGYICGSGLSPYDNCSTRGSTCLQEHRHGKRCGL